MRPDGWGAYHNRKTMELTLNLVWLCVALAGLALLRSRLKSDRTQDKLQTFVAMSCALVILFFVISMTDDLHDQEIIVEESKSARVLTSAASLPHNCHFSTENSVFLVSSASSWRFPDLPATRRPVKPSRVFFAATILLELRSGRAPPAPLA